MRRVIALALFAFPLFAQQQAPAPPPSLDPGLSDLTWKVSTGNAEAQRYFDQGMRYLYAFNHEEAVRSFRHATELDPDLAMGYWGVALALGPNINLDVDPDREKQAYQAVHQAAAHLDHASAKERDLVAALMKRYSDSPTANLRQLGVDYSNAMEAVSKKYPDDVDVATLYAESLMDLRPWKFWSHDGKPADGTEEILAALENVLKRAPHHIGANHYYIHALEASPHPERALASAKLLEHAAPAAGHLVHMPAHVYERTGNYAGAARANERGADVDRAYIQHAGPEHIYVMIYYNHNLMFGSTSNAMIGREAESQKQMDEAVSNLLPMVKEMPPIEMVAAMSLLAKARFGRWRDIIAAKPVDAGPASIALAHYARGVAFARLGNVAGAESEQRAFEAVRASLSDDPGMMQNSSKALGDVAGHLLAGRIAEANGRADEAIAEYEKAVAAEDALNYDEPSDWYYPSRETLAAALLRAGRAADAERVAHDDLKRNPKNPRSLWILAHAQQAQKQSGANAMAGFRRMWRGGPIALADL